MSVNALSGFSLFMKKYEDCLSRVGREESALFFLFNFILNLFLITNRSFVTFCHSKGIGEWFAFPFIGAGYILVLLISGLIWSIWRLYKFGWGLWLPDGWIKLLGAIGLIIMMVVLIHIFNLMAPLLAEIYYNYFGRHPN